MQTTFRFFAVSILAVVSFVVTSVVALGQDSDILVQPPLSWTVNSVRVVWTVTAGATTEEKSTSLYDKSSSESTQKIQTEIKRSTNESGTSFSVGGGVDASFGLTTNPFTLFGLTGAKAKGSAFIEGNYTNKSKDTNESSDEWTAIEKESITKAFSITVSQAQQVTISGLKLVFTVDFTNHTSQRLYFSPKSDNSIPVYCGTRHLGNAIPLNPNYTIAARRTIPCQFEMPLDDTAKMDILQKRPKIKIECGQLIIQSDPNVREPVEDAIQESLPQGSFFTIELVMQDETKQWYINWYKKKPVTLKEAFDAINDFVCSENNDDSRVLFEMKDDILVRVCNIPFELDETTDWKIQYRRFQGGTEQKVDDLKPSLSETPCRGARITFQFVDTSPLKLLKKAETNDDVQAMYDYALYLLSEESAEDSKNAVGWLTKAANKGHHEAQYQLGICYFKGIGTEKNYDKATSFLTQALNAGFVKAQNELDKIPGRRMVKTIKGVEFAFRWCPAGTFMMGSPRNESGRDNDEIQHQVTLTKGFWIMETEITQKQWKAIMGRTVHDQALKMLQNDKPYHFFSQGGISETKSTIRDYLGYSSNTEASSILYGIGDNYPIYFVSRNECIMFCDECRKLGVNFKLPTEAQWEYACRAGSTTSLYSINDNIVPLLDSIAWYKGNSQNSVHPVGKKEPNAWGIYDMIGNVWEMCYDGYQSYTDLKYIYTDQKFNDPFGVSTFDRNKRGGSCFSEQKYCRSAYRGTFPFLPSEYCDSTMGFRVIIPQE